MKHAPDCWWRQLSLLERGCSAILGCDTKSQNRNQEKEPSAATQAENGPVVVAIFFRTSSVNGSEERGRLMRHLIAMPSVPYRPLQTAAFVLVEFGGAQSVGWSRQSSLVHSRWKGKWRKVAEDPPPSSCSRALLSGRLFVLPLACCRVQGRKGMVEDSQIKFRPRSGHSTSQKQSTLSPKAAQKHHTEQHHSFPYNSTVTISREIRPRTMLTFRSR